MSSKVENGNFFSKDYTNMLKGVCCLIVIYVHFHGKYTNSLQDAIGSFGYVAVTLFFVISAYGMMLSVEKKVGYLRNFWKNRLVALLVPCFCVNIVAFIFNAIKCDFGWSVLYNINGYVLVLLQFCIWFYIVEWCKQMWFPENTLLGDGILVLGVLTSSLLLYFLKYHDVSASAGWCFERMGLIWGILLYRYYKPFVEWMGKHRLFKIIVLCLVSGILGFAYLKFKSVWFWGEYLLKVVLGIAIILFFFTLTSNRRVGNAFGMWLGCISYEVYLSHGMVMAFLVYIFPNMHSGLFVLTTVITTMLLSWWIHFVDKQIVDRLRV